MTNNTQAVQAFRQVPQGFFAANETLNTISSSNFTQMVLDLLHSLSAQSGTPTPNKYVEHGVTADQVAPLIEKETDLSEEKRAIIENLWAEYQQSSASSKVGAVGRTLSLGRLVRFSWRVGVGISGSNCTALAAPFVTLSFEIAQPTTNADTNGPSGTTAAAASTRTFLVECTHHEFQEVRKAFQEIFAAIDAV